MFSSNVKYFINGYCFKPFKKREYKIGNISLNIRKKQIQNYKAIDEKYIKERRALLNDK